MKPSHRLHTAGALGVVAALALAGCSSAGTASSDSSSGSSKPFVIATSAVATSLSPDLYAGIAQGPALDPVKGPLLAYTDVDEVKGGGTNSPTDVEPWLAESYKVTPTGIDITLGDAVSAAGNTLTPEDVKETLERVYTTKNATGEFLLATAGVDASNPVTVTGDKTLTINAKTNELSLFAFGTYFLSPLDMTEVKKHETSSDPQATDWLKTHSAMFGPYSVSSFTPGKEIRYTANPHYTKQKLAYGSVVTQAVPDVSGRISLVQTGQANLIDGIPFDTLKTLEKNKTLHIQQVSNGSQDVIDLDNKSLSDPRVRQAISYAIDRKALVEGPYQGFGKASTSTVSSAIANEGGEMATATYDPEKAKELLKAAGAEHLQLSITTSQSEISNVSADALLTALKQQLSKVGITVTTTNVASDADFFAAFKAGKYQAAIRTEGPLAADPVYMYGLYYATGASSAFGHYDNATLNEAIKTAAPLTGADRAKAIAVGIEAANSAQLTIPLVESVSGFVYSATTCPGPVNRSFEWTPAAATVCK